jgi:hypothetical protein
LPIICLDGARGIYGLRTPSELFKIDFDSFGHKPLVTRRVRLLGSSKSPQLATLVIPNYLNVPRGLCGAMFITTR